jgi:hypothetical protein
MKSIIPLLSAFLAFLLFSGCSTTDRSFEARREADIQFYKQRLASTKSEVVLKRSKDILAALASVNINSITHPHPASAILAKGQNSAYSLIIFWIENHPSVDGIEFYFSNKNSSTILAMPDWELKQVHEHDELSVVFGSENDWQPTDEFWKNLEQITNAKDLKVRLLRKKAPLTDWIPVDFYKNGKWISGNSPNVQNGTSDVN